MQFYQSFRACRSCGTSLLGSPAHHRVCKACYARARREQDIQAAYARGFQAGRLVAPALPRLEPTRLRQLLQLCHPDRHGGSRAATEATQWLLEQRGGAQ